MKMKDYVIILERRIQSLEDVAHEPQYHMNWNKGLEQIKENMSEDRGDEDEKDKRRITFNNFME